ncbi:hypothetical protein IKE67_05615 [bacterium]|nr:hypothetical protein [bacterium]
MKKITQNLSELIHKTQAFYSTDFSADYEMPADLLEMLIENEDTKEHVFYGVIFLQKKDDNSFVIIDGLKRLISLSLLLHAICECYKLTNKKNEHAIALIKKRYLFNDFGTKIQLNGYEKNIYEKIVNYGKMTPEEKEHPMFKTLHLFWAKIKMNNISAIQLFDQIKHIQVITYIFENSNIDNLELYQCLNCNNPNLNQIRLISSFIKNNSEKGYELWQDILNLFKNADMERKFKYFLFDFLSIQKNGIIPKDNEIFISFKKYYLKMINSGLSPENLLSSMKITAGYYIKISTANFENEEIKTRIQAIKNSNMYETFPYLLEVTEDYENKRITSETFCQLLDNVILFIAEQRSGNYESIINFANLSQEINLKMEKDAVNKISQKKNHLK